MTTYLTRIFLVLALLTGMAVTAWGAEPLPVGGAETVEQEATHEAKQGLPASAVRLRERGFLSNSMFVTWIVAAGLIIFARRAMKNAQPVPGGAQNFWEWMVESLYHFLEDIIGRDLVKKSFWFFATIFIFILFANWAGLFPGVGSIGWGTPHKPGGHLLEHVSRPLLRGVNADLNMTFAMAMIFFACWIVWAIQANGPGGFILHLFGPKGDTTGALKVLMIFIFIMAGLLEVVTILFRPLTLSFRLYGNVFAGENMLESTAHLIPWLGWLIPLPFYFLEVLVGFVQALVFMLLTAVFTLLIMPDEEHKKAHH